MTRCAARPLPWLRPALLAAAALLGAAAHAADGPVQPGLKLRAGGLSSPGTSLVDVSLRLPGASWLPGWARSLSPAPTDELALLPRRLGGAESPWRASGLHASGGVVGVSRHTALGALPSGDYGPAGPADLSLAGPRNTFASGLTVSVPYVGIGYSSALGNAGAGGLRPALGGWGFSADLGVMALGPRAAVRLDRTGGPQSLEDVLRDVRLTPLLQLGITYTF